MVVWRGAKIVAANAFVRADAFIADTTCARLWIRSYRHVDKIDVIVPGTWVLLLSDYGALHPASIPFSDHEQPKPFDVSFQRDMQIPPGVGIGDENPKFNGAGIAWGFLSFPGVRNGQACDLTMRWLSLNYLWPALLGLLLPAAWLRSFFKRGRPVQSPALCSVCGYHLRATPHRYPECGTEAQHQSALKPI